MPDMFVIWNHLEAALFCIAGGFLHFDVLLHSALAEDFARNIQPTTGLRRAVDLDASVSKHKTAVWTSLVPPGRHGPWYEEVHVCRDRYSTPEKMTSILAIGRGIETSFRHLFDTHIIPASPSCWKLMTVVGHELQDLRGIWPRALSLLITKMRMSLTISQDRREILQYPSTASRVAAKPQPEGGIQ